jgi:hypothetical protein
MLNIANGSNGAENPLTLNLDNATLAISGSRGFGDGLTIDASGVDRLNANAVSTISTTIDVATHSELIVTGSMNFGYSGTVFGAGTIVNDGTLAMTDATIGAAVMGTGVIKVSQYHDGFGETTISGPVGAGQTLQLNPLSLGCGVTLTDPHAFAGAVDLVDSPLSSQGSSVVLQGIVGTSISVRGDLVTVLDGSKAVDYLRVDNASGMSISMSMNNGSVDIGITPPHVS